MDAGNAPPLVSNTVLDANAGGNCNGTLFGLGHTLQHPDPACGASIPVADPLLGVLDTGHAGPAFEPTAGSPAVDAGDLRVCGSEPVSGIDQRGMARPTGGQAGCDIGAVEAGSMHTPTPGYTPVAAPTEPPDLVPGAYGHYQPTVPGACPGKQVSGGASVAIENRGASPAGPFVVEYGGVRQEVDRLGAYSSALLYDPMSGGAG